MSSEEDRRTHRGRRFGPTLALIVAVFTMGGGAATIAGLPFGEGSPKPEDRDPFFERAGNSGYSVDSYDVELDYEPRSNRLRGTVTMSAQAQGGLDSFYVDMRRNLTLRQVTVNGGPASTERADGKAGGQDVKIVPEVGVPGGLPFSVEMRFGGRPESRGGTGWKQTSDGAVALNEPRGVPSWMPVNDDLRDKATFDWRMTVPKRLQAVANGRYEGREVDGRSATYTWTGDDPMSSYLSLVAIGRFDISRSRVAGVPSWVAVDKGLRRSGDGVRALPRIQRYFSKIFGPYPFSSTGAMVDAMPFNYALETQTRSAFPGHPGDVLMAHELAHQWFGDSVGLERWPDMWLNEGFATWAQWRWVQHRGGEPLGKRFRRICSIPDRNASIWRPAPNAIPRAGELFANSVYIRGGMTLEALREEIGRAEFGELLRRWASENRHGSVDTKQFESLAEEISGEQLDAFFDDWLREAPKPAGCRDDGGEDARAGAAATRSSAVSAAALPARIGHE